MPFRPSRRELLHGALGLPLLSSLARQPRPAPPAIDRRALVDRHRIVLTSRDVQSPLQVGNGEFAFTADVTGLQTFADAYEDGMPLGTMAQWAWHSFPEDPRLDLDDIHTEYDSHGRRVRYADGRGGYSSEAPPGTPHPAVWLRANPHRIHLGRIALAFAGPQRGGDLTIDALAEVSQALDLWSGRLESRMRIHGDAAAVTTVCHPELDVLAIRVRSPLVAAGRLGVTIDFPYPAGEWTRTADWSAESRHETRTRTSGQATRFDRIIDGSRYAVIAAPEAGAAMRQLGRHRFRWTSDGGDTLQLCLRFLPEDAPEGMPTFAETRQAAGQHWERFWTGGGAIDLAASDDRRAPELERRIVLSQYVTAVNCAGTVPPQETGLVTNSWYGKHHLEMHWWHAAHFALWNRPPLLERSLGWYERILPRAKENAARQGYRGARWPKQAGIDGRESPSGVSVFLVWQQPHPIFYAELLYRSRPMRETANRFAALVFESAAFMASYAAWDAGSTRYVLGPPLIPAQESYGAIRARVINPTFELAYWHWGLATAQLWRERLGLPRDPLWDRVVAHLSRPAVRNGAYAAIEVEPFTTRADHPSMLAALGVLPEGPLVHPDVMRRTLHDVRREWDWETTWGWDYPMMAMTAARVGEPDRAIEALLMDTPKNRYLPNGHNYQTPRLPLYLPGNGGLLYAAAMMAAGWDGAPAGPAPGFPAGRWTVRAEGLAPAV